MNYLAHIYLASEVPDLILGNYIADSIKGKQYESYPKGIQKGIIMHRDIDTFTDEHPIVRASILKFRPELSKFAGIAVDVVYDHFLAVKWTDHHSKSLDDFAQDVYRLLHEHWPHLTPQSQRFYHYMTTRNILVNYQHLEHLQQVFNGMAARSKYVSNLEKSVPVLIENYSEIETEFELFFVELKDYIQRKYFSE